MVSPMRRRRSAAFSLAKWTALAASIAAMSVAASASADAVNDRRLVDSDGLAFVSSEAFCSLHCKPWRRDRALTQCSAAHCPQFHRRLETAGSEGAAVHGSSSDAVSTVSVLTCGDIASPSHVDFSIDADTSSTTLTTMIRGFHDAFFTAFDAMVVSENATVQACQLQWLQQDLLSSIDLPASTTDAATAAKPMLVKFDPTADQRSCAAQIKAIWSDDDERVTPFLSRVDQSSASATVQLLHLPETVATKINALSCVTSVLELPSILKLLPFARSAAQYTAASDQTPAMWVRVLNGTSPQEVFDRLTARLSAIDGVTNVFELPERPELFPRGVFIKSIAHVELWAHAVALAAADDQVEWVDIKHEVSFHTNIRSMAYYPPTERRLDEYVESLVGIEPAQRQGINGDDVVVGITDSGLYIDHDQFDQDSRAMYDRVDLTARKVVYYYTWADEFDQSEEIQCGHGTHVSGLLAGSSFSGQSANIGIAANARVAFMDIGMQSSTCAGQANCAVTLATPADASQLLQSQMAVGARIFSFSWGTPGSDYSSQARDLDDFIYNNPDVLIVVAAGNSGEEASNGQGTISSPSGAKNVISVGASLNSAESFSSYGCSSVFNPSSVASFSSAGPTTDGRMKPDVVAPGMVLVSSRSERPGSTTKTSQTCSLQGTSQATPVVTGVAVLLYQWLRDGWWKAGKKDAAYGMSTIPAALLKALIVHSGQGLQRRLARFPSGPVSCAGLERNAWDLTYPDMYQGYGKPNMSNIADFSNQNATPSLYFLPNSTKGSEPSVANGKEVRISFTVPRGVDLRATIVWTDPPGSIRATRQLQHDLDLSVQIRNTDKVFYALTASNGTNRDDKNNVEMVEVSYDQLLAAVRAGSNGSNASDLLGPSGEIVVEAIVYGRSVLLANAQTFAFVASSSVIGTTSGVAGGGDGNGGNSGNSGTTDSSNPLSSSFWTPWTIGGVAIGAIVLLLVIASCVRCCTNRKRRRSPAAASHNHHPTVVGGASVGMSYYPHSTPTGAQRGAIPGLETCPYCAFACGDVVVMVNHVENMHTDAFGIVNNGIAPGQTGMYPPPPPPPFQQPMYQHPQYPMYHDQQHVAAPVGHRASQATVNPDEACPFCSFVSSDPVILVNHVENLHGEQRFI